MFTEGLPCGTIPCYPEPSLEEEVPTEPHYPVTAWHGELIQEAGSGHESAVKHPSVSSERVLSWTVTSYTFHLGIIIN